MMKLAVDAALRRKLPPVEAAPAIDLVHLARMTLGDATLEREVLTLFERQAGILLDRMRGSPRPAIAAFAHTLKGSARGVGAWRVAEAAGIIEWAASLDDRATAQALAGLAAAVEEAKAVIAEMLQAARQP